MLLRSSGLRLENERPSCPSMPRASRDLVRRGVLCTSMTRPSLSYTSSSHPLQISVPARTRLPTRATRQTRGFAPAGGAAVTSPASARGTERIARRTTVETTSELAYVIPSQTLGGAFEMQRTDESKLA